MATQEENNLSSVATITTTTKPPPLPLLRLYLKVKRPSSSTSTENKKAFQVIKSDNNNNHQNCSINSKTFVEIEIEKQQQQQQTTTNTIADDQKSSKIQYQVDGVWYNEDNNNNNNKNARIFCNDISQQLTNGYNCTIVTYGASQTGKTYTLFGDDDDTNDIYKKKEEDGNIFLLSQLIQSIFYQLEQQQAVVQVPPSSSLSSVAEEVSIRCSCVEIYSNRIRDLIYELNSNQCSIQDPNQITTTTTTSSSYEVIGCTKLSCISAKEVIDIIHKANAKRTTTTTTTATTTTTTSTKLTSSSSSSTLLIQLYIEQKVGNKIKGSQLKIYDLLSSSTYHTTSTSQISTTKNVEGYNKNNNYVVSQSLKLLHEQIKKQILSIKEQQDYNTATTTGNDNLLKHATIPLKIIPIANDLPILTKLLVSTFLGYNNCFITLLLTTTNDDNTNQQMIYNTMEFGQDCRTLLSSLQQQNINNNNPTPNIIQIRNPIEQNQERRIYEQKKMRMDNIVKGLANECIRLRNGEKADPTLSLIINQIHTLAEQQHNLLQQQQQPISNNNIESFQESYNQSQFEINQLKEQVQSLQTQYNTVVNINNGLQSDLCIIQEKNKVLVEEQKQLQNDLIQMKQENELSKLQNADVQYKLRISQFRENEAIVYMRQLRRFYYRLLKQISAERNGGGRQTMMMIAGAPDLTNLIDIDYMMMESGLLEKEDVQGLDISMNVQPSSMAMERSSDAVTELMSNETIIAGGVGSIIISSNEKTAHSSSADFVPLNTVIPSPQSIVTRVENGDMIEARQKLYQTPAGKYLVMRENKLEQEILQLSQQCVQLKQQLNEERTNVKLLKAASSMTGIVNDQMRIAQQFRLLKDQLNKKENDLKAVIYKMNELHMISKSIKTDKDNREQHIKYLESKIIRDLQNQIQITINEKNSMEQQLKDEITSSEKKLSDLSAPIWQLPPQSSSSSSSVEATNASLPPLSCRLIVPFMTTSDGRKNVDNKVEEDKQSYSLGDVGEWILDHDFSNLIAQDVPQRAAAISMVDNANDVGTCYESVIETSAITVTKNSKATRSKNNDVRSAATQTEPWVLIFDGLNNPVRAQPLVDYSEPDQNKQVDPLVSGLLKQSYNDYVLSTSREPSAIISAETSGPKDTTTRVVPQNHGTGDRCSDDNYSTNAAIPNGRLQVDPKNDDSFLIGKNEEASLQTNDAINSGNEYTQISAFVEPLSGSSKPDVTPTFSGTSTIEEERAAEDNIPQLVVTDCLFMTDEPETGMQQHESKQRNAENTPNESGHPLPESIQQKEEITLKESEHPLSESMAETPNRGTASVENETATETNSTEENEDATDIPATDSEDFIETRRLEFEHQQLEHAQLEQPLQQVEGVQQPQQSTLHFENTVFSTQFVQQEQRQQPQLLPGETQMIQPQQPIQDNQQELHLQQPELQPPMQELQRQEQFRQRQLNPIETQMIQPQLPMQELQQQEQLPQPQQLLPSEKQMQQPQLPMTQFQPQPFQQFLQQPQGMQLFQQPQQVFQLQQTDQLFQMQFQQQQQLQQLQVHQQQLLQQLMETQEMQQQQPQNTHLMQLQFQQQQQLQQLQMQQQQLLRQQIETQTLLQQQPMQQFPQLQQPVQSTVQMQQPQVLQQPLQPLQQPLQPLQHQQPVTQSQSQQSTQQQQSANPPSDATNPKPGNTIVEKLRKQAERKLQLEKGQTGTSSGKPEFMALFNKIGSKNANVIETSGAKPASDAVRGAFGENTLKGKKSGLAFNSMKYETTRGWKPRKRRGSDSDSSSDSIENYKSNCKSSDDDKSDSSPITTHRYIKDSDSEEEDQTPQQPYKPPSPPPKPPSPPPKPPSPPPKPPSPPPKPPSPPPPPKPVRSQKDSDSDSDSSSDKRKKAAPIAKPAAAPPPPKRAPPAKKKSFLDDSDSDSDSS